ncbi:MAG: beta-1,6-N-acetylglucosaminyltransferase [Solirubrobacteraceae bacterium]
MSALATVILAHSDPAKTRRLIGALAGTDVFLHCDRRAPDDVVRRMVSGTGPDVTLVPRRRTSLSSWSLVEAELAALRLALERSRADHIAVLSGSCYPLLSVAEMVQELSDWRGLSRIQLNPLPWRPWDTPRNPNGGYWRFRRRFVTLRGQIVTIRRVPLRLFRRAIPAGLRLHASSQWKVYARHHAAGLLRVLGDSPEQRRFWQTTLVPDESCAASILASPELVGSISDELRDDSPWFIKWPPGQATGHPQWLEEPDFPMLQAARSAPPRDPHHDIPKSEHGAFRKLFARKLSSRERPLLDCIDKELRT